MLQCATAECVLRLDRTVLQKEAEDLQRHYLVEQQHENLPQYLTYQLSQTTSDPVILLQVNDNSKSVGYK